ncbi:MAG: hypothetical protein B6D64_14480 [Bacteroidetes bacterium 4484_276]|nr:MAG: hypothetical protein B6D64_14480 [Bacteroidetes bacterium 4484_276]
MEKIIKEKIRVSAVSYLNTLPFIFGLEQSKIMQTIELSLDTPAQCANKLINDEADAGLVPVASIPEINSQGIISDFCIGADGAVKTVLLLSNHPLARIDTIFLDTESRTSVKLVRVLANKFWKREFTWKPITEFQDNQQGQAGLVLIGDKTFVESPKYKFSIDLAQEWKKFTGLPFVFACWVANKKLPEEFIRDFNKSMKYGIDNIGAAVQIFQNGLISKPELKDYLEHSISYNLDEAKKKAMELFLNYSKNL